MSLSVSKIRGKQPIERRLLIPMNDEHAEMLEEAQSLVSHASFGGDADALEKAKTDHASLQDRLVAEGSLMLIFRGIGRDAFRALQLDHPATETEKEESADIVWSPATFPAALCSASAIDSDLTPEEWLKDVFQSPSWGLGELNAVFNAAFEANSSRRVVELGN